MQENKKYSKVIQITDTHLFGTNDHLYGVDTNKNFNDVLKKIMDDELSDLEAIFLTGDISQDHSVESYELIANKLKMLNKPIYWIAGNHDSVDLVSSVFASYPNFIALGEMELGGWTFITVNSCLEQRDEGMVTEADILSLQNKKSLPLTKKLALVMHHQPMDVGTPLVDKYGLTNRDTFADAISKSRIDLIICGHVHHDYSLQGDGFKVEAGPASCLQWKKGASTLEVDHRVGYKVYYFSNTDYTCQAKIWSV